MPEHADKAEGLGGERMGVIMVVIVRMVIEYDNIKLKRNVPSDGGNICTSNPMTMLQQIGARTFLIKRVSE